MPHNKLQATKANSKNCAICLEPTSRSNPRLKLKPCGHNEFHTTCVMNWLINSSTCPICTQQVTKAGKTAVEFKKQAVSSDYSSTLDESEISRVVSEINNEQVASDSALAQQLAQQSHAHPSSSPLTTTSDKKEHKARETKERESKHKDRPLSQLRPTPALHNEQSLGGSSSSVQLAGGSATSITSGSLSSLSSHSHVSLLYASTTSSDTTVNAMPTSTSSPSQMSKISPTSARHTSPSSGGSELVQVPDGSASPTKSARSASTAIQPGRLSFAEATARISVDPTNKVSNQPSKAQTLSQPTPHANTSSPPRRVTRSQSSLASPRPSGETRQHRRFRLRPQDQAETQTSARADINNRSAALSDAPDVSPDSQQHGTAQLSQTNSTTDPASRTKDKPDPSLPPPSVSSASASIVRVMSVGASSDALHHPEDRRLTESQVRVSHQGASHPDSASSAPDRGPNARAEDNSTVYLPPTRDIDSQGKMQRTAHLDLQAMAARAAALSLLASHHHSCPQNKQSMTRRANSCTKDHGERPPTTSPNSKPLAWHWSSLLTSTAKRSM
jgi:hypothetical protein